MEIKNIQLSGCSWRSMEICSNAPPSLGPRPSPAGVEARQQCSQLHVPMRGKPNGTKQGSGASAFMFRESGLWDLISKGLPIRITLASAFDEWRMSIEKLNIGEKIYQTLYCRNEWRLLLLEVPASHQSCHLIWQVIILGVHYCLATCLRHPETTALSPGWKGDVSSSSPCAKRDQRRWSPKRYLQIEGSIENILERTVTWCHAGTHFLVQISH